MPTIYTINQACPSHLEDVRTEMLSLGAPEIHVVDCGDYFQALEGSHRIIAAKDLGLEPILIIHEQNEVLDVTGFDWFNPIDWENEVLAGDVASGLYSQFSVAITF